MHSFLFHLRFTSRASFTSDARLAGIQVNVAVFVGRLAFRERALECDLECDLEEREDEDFLLGRLRGEDRFE